MTKISGFAVLIVVFVLGFFAVPANAQSKSSSSASPQDELRPLIARLEAAANAHDTDKFLELYLRSPELVFVVNGDVIHGFDDLRAQQLKWWKNGKSDVVYTRRAEPEFTVISDKAVVVTLLIGSERTGADGKVAKNAAAISLVWQKFSEGWRVVYTHESTEH